MTNEAINSAPGAPSWRKSTRSLNNGNCVEVRRLIGQVQVRDSKDPGGPMLTFDSDAWKAMLGAVALGRLNQGD